MFGCEEEGKSKSERTEGNELIYLQLVWIMQLTSGRNRDILVQSRNIQR